MARPKKTAEERRSEVVRFLCRPDEYALILAAAKAAGMSVSDYGRAMCLTGQITTKQARKLDYETYDQLRRIGVNLNQAVHKFHATGEAPPALISAAVMVEQFLFNQMDE